MRSSVRGRETSADLTGPLGRRVARPGGVMVLGVLALAGAANTAAAQVSITPLPKLNGNYGFYSVSDDGRSIAGYLFPSGQYLVGPEFATIWTAERGLSVCPDPTIRFSLERPFYGGSRGQTHFTNDGQYALAHRVTPVPGQLYDRFQPVKVRLSDWTIIELPGIGDSAAGMSADGGTIVGNDMIVVSDPVDPFAPFRSWKWQEGQGVTRISKPDEAIGVTHLSADARIMTGSVYGSPYAYRWTDGVPTRLESPPAPLTDVYSADLVPSRSGRVVASRIGNPNSLVGDQIALLCEDGVWEPLFPVEAPSLGGYFVPNAVSDAGDRATFVLYPYDGVNFQTYVWDRTLGLLRFDEFIAAFGLAVPTGVSALYGEFMSPDGLHFRGAGATTTGFEFFAISVPSPGITGLAAFGLLTAARGRRQ